VVFTELFWTPGVLMQAEDRAHRIGQQNTVEVRFLLAHKTVDDIIWPLVERKLNVLGKTMDGEARQLNAVRVKPS
jgi:SWI/SNF-related matrix-associated actin-dependent regulator 1 of chromatin subfamily A